MKWNIDNTKQAINIACSDNTQMYTQNRYKWCVCVCVVQCACKVCVYVSVCVVYSSVVWCVCVVSSEL